MKNENWQLCGGKWHLLDIMKWQNNSFAAGAWDGWGWGRAGRMEMRAILQHFLQLRCVIVRNHPPCDKSPCLRKERLWGLIWKFPFLYTDNILRGVKIGIAIPSLVVIALGTAFLSLLLMEKCIPLITLSTISAVGEVELHYMGCGRRNWRKFTLIRDLMGMPGWEGGLCFYSHHIGKMIVRFVLSLSWGPALPWLHQELPHPSHSPWAVYLPFCLQETGVAQRFLDRKS